MSNCCEIMADHLNMTCPVHAEQCPEQVIRQFDDYTYVLPVHDGGDSGIAINYCPWCGQPLSEDAERTFWSAFHFDAAKETWSLAAGKIPSDALGPIREAAPE